MNARQYSSTIMAVSYVPAKPDKTADGKKTNKSRFQVSSSTVLDEGKRPTAHGVAKIPSDNWGLIQPSQLFDRKRNLDDIRFNSNSQLESLAALTSIGLEESVPKVKKISKGNGSAVRNIRQHVSESF
jgi:hypothetical protein